MIIESRTEGGGLHGLDTSSKALSTGDNGPCRAITIHKNVNSVLGDSDVFVIDTGFNVDNISAFVSLRVSGKSSLDGFKLAATILGNNSIRPNICSPIFSLHFSQKLAIRSRDP